MNAKSDMSEISIFVELLLNIKHVDVLTVVGITLE